MQQPRKLLQITRQIILGVFDADRAGRHAPVIIQRLLFVLIGVVLPCADQHRTHQILIKAAPVQDRRRDRERVLVVHTDRVQTEVRFFGKMRVDIAVGDQVDLLFAEAGDRIMIFKR